MSGEEPRASSAWADAAQAAALFAVDVRGTAGISLRALPGPVRDRWLELLCALLPDKLRRIPLHVSDGRLLGGLDLAATLESGRRVAERGLLAEADGGVVLLAMAERLPLEAAGRLGSVIDAGEVILERDGFAERIPARVGVVALDEGIAEDERPPAGLCDRLAFHVTLSSVGVRDLSGCAVEPGAVAAARARLPDVAAGDEVIEALSSAALALGIPSLRAPWLALRAARAAAALAGRLRVEEQDCALAARLVFSSRAAELPAEESAPGSPQEEAPEEEAPHEEAPAESSEGDGEETPEAADTSLEERVLEAAKAAIPAGLLQQLRQAQGRARSGAAGRAGARRHSGLRGRPAGARRGRPGRGARLHLVETLRAAAPWQTLRQQGPQRARVKVRRDDFRVTRYRRRAETTTIFAVDASGSTALQRLAEAKGAVELLLGECYVRRDRVALVSFRGRAADLLLPPTRSLVRARRSLAGLPGGGATPLSAGIDGATQLADAVLRRGGTPLLIFLTDGHANIARDGTPGRVRAHDDALQSARALRAAELGALLVDTSPRPQARAQELAREMNARYLPLPHADAQALSSAVRQAAAMETRSQVS